MAKRFTKFLAALALLVFMAPSMVMWGQTRSEVTYTFSEHYSANTTLTDVAIAFDNSITGTFGKGNGSTAPQYYTNGTAVRWYGGNTLAITASNATVSEIVLTYTQKNKTVTTDVGTYNHDNGTWSGSASSVTFTVESGGGHNRVSAIKVTYSASGSTPTCATPTFSPAAGTYTQAQSVSISCATEGATVYYTTNGQDPTTNSTVYSGAINVSTNTTIKAMAVKSGFDNSAVATAEYAFITLEHAGTLEDPYTVADARTAIDANAGTQGVYATGIVSEIPTAWSSQYNNITFNFVDEQGDENFLQAYRCVSGTGVDASTVAVGDIVVVYGNLTKYGSTYEFGQGCELVSLTSSGNPSITANNVEITYDTDADEIEYVINNAVSGGSLVASTDSDWLEVDSAPMSGNAGTIEFTCSVNTAANSRTAIVTLTYNYNRAIVIKKVTVTQAANPNATMTIAEVRAQETGDVVTTGTVTSCVGTTGYIQDATAAICVYGTSLTVGDNISVLGTLSTYNGLLEIIDPQVTVISSGNTINPETMTVAQAVASTNQGWYIRIEDATVTAISDKNVTIAQGDANVVVRFANTSDITFEVNDIISLNGNIGAFNGVQIANPQNVTVQENTNPIISAENVSIAFDATGGNIDFTIDNPVSGGVTSATTNDEWLTLGTVGSATVPFTCTANTATTARTATVVLTYTYNRATVTKEVTVTQAALVIDYAVLPFIWEGGPKADFLALNGVTAHGLGSDYASNNAPYLIKFDHTGDYIQVKCDQQPGKVTIGVKMIGGGETSTITIQSSADGETFTDIETLTISGAQGGELTLETSSVFADTDRYVRLLFTKGSNVGVGPITIEKGNASSITVTPATLDLEAVGTMTGGSQMQQLSVTYHNLDIESYSDFTVQFYDAQGEEQTQPDWIFNSVYVSGGGDLGYMVDLMISENDGPARSAYFKVYASDAESNVVYSNLVTINQAAAVVPATGDEYALYTGELVEGDYLIVYDGGAMNTTVESDRLQFEVVTATNDVIVTDNAAIVWHIAPSGQYWTIYNADADAYAASTGVKNKAQMLADGTDDKALWTVSGTETYEFVNKHNAANSVNANLRKNGTYGFACYATSTGGALSLYKKVESGTPVTQTLSLSEGENWVSFNVKTTLDDLKAALQGVNNATDIKITSQNNGYTYWDGSTWRGTLNPFDVSQMFVIEVIGACEISFEAMPVNPARPITIVNGTNWIGFPFSESMSLSNAFSGFAENGDKILAPNGSFATFNGDNWEGGLTDLLPGQGYKYEVTTTGERILVFPSSK